jgi:hypothetical protein
MMKTNLYTVKPYDIDKLRKERQELLKKKKDTLVASGALATSKHLSTIELIRQSNRLAAMLENELM